MTVMNEARDEEMSAYENVLAGIRPNGVSFSEHPGAKYLVTGFGEGFGRGYQVSSGAAHAGLSSLIFGIDAGLIDLDNAKAQLIGLRDAIKEAAGL